ncbi:hypothetical protein WCLP8_2040001 [uncultured Gammaproteobacteria bacterium]
MPCPKCGAFAVIEWAQIEWPEGQRHLAHRVCPHCQGVAEERDKPAMLAGGRWTKTAEGDGKTAGFHISTLYSPFETWGEIAVGPTEIGQLTLLFFAFSFTVQDGQNCLLSTVIATATAPRLRCAAIVACSTNTISTSAANATTGRRSR